MGWFDRMDTDNDGSAIDDGLKLGTGVVGAGLMGLGGLGAATGAGLASLGGAAMGIGAMEGASVLGIPTGAVTAGVGAGMIGLGTLLGVGGTGVAGVGGLPSTNAAANVSEEVGDFTADLFGTRGAPPFSQSEDADPFYLSGRTDGLGQQLHQFIFGDGKEEQARPPQLSDVLVPSEPVPMPE